MGELRSKPGSTINARLERVKAKSIREGRDGTTKYPVSIQERIEVAQVMLSIVSRQLVAFLSSLNGSKCTKVALHLPKLALER